MPVNDAKLDETLNITPTEVSTTPEGGCVKRQDQLTDVTNVGITKPERLVKDDIQKDYDYTRGNLYSIIEKGQEAINGILELAQDNTTVQNHVKGAQVFGIDYTAAKEDSALIQFGDDFGFDGSIE